jgi:hypothetical protein
MRTRIFCLATSIVIACFSAHAQTIEPKGYNPVQYHQIELGTAKTLTGGFQGANPTPVISTVAGTLSATSVRALLNTPRAVYLREYFALDNNGVLHILLVPKTADNHDIILPRITDADGTMVSEATARLWIKNFVASKLFTEYGKVYASSIHKDAVFAVIEKNNAASVRFYFALEPDNRLGVVLSGVAAPSKNAKAATTQGERSAYIADKNCCPASDSQQGELAR